MEFEYCQKRQCMVQNGTNPLRSSGMWGFRTGNWNQKARKYIYIHEDRTKDLPEIGRDGKCSRCRGEKILDFRGHFAVNPGGALWYSVTL